MSKKMVRIVGIYILIICGLSIGIGVKINMDNIKNQRWMVEVVKSEEAKVLREKIIYQEDPKAFTPEGIIKSYEIDEDSIYHNPMGGIMYTIIVNGDENLIINLSLNKFNKSNDELSNGAYSLSVDLAKMLGGYYE